MSSADHGHAIAAASNEQSRSVALVADRELVARLNENLERTAAAHRERVAAAAALVKDTAELVAVLREAWPDESTERTPLVPMAELVDGGGR